MTALSPCIVGIVATRRSISTPLTTIWARPSWGKRRSVMFKPAKILIRDTMPFAMLRGGAEIPFRMPSMRRRTCRAPAKGSICRSVARWSTASRKNSSTARTTGAPRARSRRSSRLSSAVAVSAGAAKLFVCSGSRVVANAASISSGVATAIFTGFPSAISMARMVSLSTGVAIASTKVPDESSNGNSRPSFRKRFESGMPTNWPPVSSRLWRRLHLQNAASSSASADGVSLVRPTQSTSTLASERPRYGFRRS